MAQLQPVQNSVLKGALLIVLAELMLSIMAALIKEASAELNSFQLVFFRNIFGLLFLLPLLARQGVSVLKTDKHAMHFLRAITGVSAMMGFFFVLANMPLAEASIVKFTAPFFLPLIAWFWLGERISRRNKLAIVAGFVGALFILKPSSDGVQWVALIGLLAAAFASTAKVSIRKMAGEPSLRIVVYFALYSSVISAVPLLWVWQDVSDKALLLMLLMGLFGTLGQLAMTKAYKIASPGAIGPYVYTSLLWAGLFGFVFWGEVIALTSAFGMAIIIAAGVFNVRKG